jgi:hypothetical protein
VRLRAWIDASQAHAVMFDFCVVFTSVLVSSSSSQWYGQNTILTTFIFGQESNTTLNQGCQFRSVSPGMAEMFHTNSYQFKKRNKTEQISSHFKSRSVPDFSAKFHPERSGFIPHVSFRS